MSHKTGKGVTRVVGLALVGGVILAAGGCATAPKKKERPAFTAGARAATGWFEDNVPGLRAQIDASAGYIIFPEIGQWGLGISGGKFGRGLVNTPNDSQIGWAAINAVSLGLQVGVQGFKMLLVIQDAAALEKFKQNDLSGSISGIAVVGKAGGSGEALFHGGVAVYQGANTGLMVGANLGLDYLRYEPVAD